MGELKKPQVVKNLFNTDLHESLVSDLRLRFPNQGYYDVYFGRFLMGEDQSSVMQEAFNASLETAREVFDSPTLLPSYALFAHYESRGGVIPSLIMHRDDNACTYTLDMCVYQTEPWDLYVEGTPYTLYPNEALAYYGNDQEHWRGDFPNPSTQSVAMVFFHFVEPDHWFFTKGSDYVEVKQGRMTEEQWITSHQK